MGQLNEHETEIDLMDDTAIDDGMEADDRGDELTQEQLDAWKDEADEEIIEDADELDADPADDEAAADDAGDNGAADADAGDADDGAAEQRGSRMVPHGRFNEVNEQYKQEREARLRLEEELARLRGAQPQQPDQAEATPEQVQQAQDASDFDFDEAENRYGEAIYDGDMETAKQIRAEIRAAERKAAEDAARAVLEQERAQMAQVQQQQQLQTTVSKAYEQYPFLNPDAADMNQDAIDEVVALRNLYLQRGDTPAEAIARAVDKVGPRYGEPAITSKPSETLTQQRKREALDRNQQRADRIPPTGEGIGERARVTDYSNLSDAEWDALPEAEKRKARGDFLK